MTTISKKDVLKVGRLAKLDIPEEIIEDYVNDMSSILELIDQMKSIDTEGVEPVLHPVDFNQALSQDARENGYNGDKFNTEHRDSDYYLVPRFIHK